jgi:DNA-binding response OmpR family regulator
MFCEIDRALSLNCIEKIGIVNSAPRKDVHLEKDVIDSYETHRGYEFTGVPMVCLLYVDDEPQLLDIAKIFLEKTKEFSVDVEASAKAGLELSKSKSYDAIVSDYQMPEMDGIEFLKQVRSTWGDVPFILFTGRGRQEVVIEAINNGADFYLHKGGDPKSQFAELAHKIRQAVRRKQAGQSGVFDRDIESGRIVWTQ